MYTYKHVRPAPGKRDPPVHRLLALGRMRKPTTAAAVLLASTSPVFADVYLGLGVEARPLTSDALTRRAEPSTTGMRYVLGVRIARISLEAALDRSTVDPPAAASQTMTQASVALKLSLPLPAHLEAFGRAGPERTWIGMGDAAHDLSGNGFLVGTGVELGVNLVVTRAALFADYTLHRASLDSAVDHLSVTSHVLAVGVAVGL
jgi:hypothetical protein